jgi:predicted RNA-binding Zn ribbon-like protein
MKFNYDPYEAIGGNLCLDYINTLCGNRKSTVIEYIHSYSDLLHWALSLQIIDDSMSNELLSRSKIEKIASQETLSFAIQLRETLYQMIISLRNGKTIVKEDLTFFNNVLQKVQAQKILTFISGKGKLMYNNNITFDRVIWPVIDSAVEIFTEQTSFSHIRECGNNSCGWLFLDQTKNKSRKWCDMAICGNRVKQRKFQVKLKIKSK